MASSILGKTISGIDNPEDSLMPQPGDLIAFQKTITRV
jgi:hypothetical protein